MKITFGHMALRVEDASWLPNSPQVLAQHNDVRLVGKRGDSAREALHTMEWQANDDIGEPSWRRAMEADSIAAGAVRILLEMVRPKGEEKP